MSRTRGPGSVRSLQGLIEAAQEACTSSLIHRKRHHVTPGVKPCTLTLKHHPATVAAAVKHALSEEHGIRCLQYLTENLFPCLPVFCRTLLRLMPLRFSLAAMPRSQLIASSWDFV